MPRKAADTVAAYYREIAERRPDADFSQQMSYVELRNRLPELLLMRVDKFSMQHSLEARAPFLDHELATYALSLPAAMKMDGDADQGRAQGRRARLAARATSSSAPSRASGCRCRRGCAASWRRGARTCCAARRCASSACSTSTTSSSCGGATARAQADHSFDLWCLINLSGWYEHWFAT